ncbi:hypothetical protein Tco_0276295 [Tanacetum coccineum]
MLLACSSYLDLANSFVNGTAGLSSDRSLVKATAILLSQNISTRSCTIGTTPRSLMKFYIQIASFESSQAAIYSDSHMESATVSCFELFHVTASPFSKNTQLDCK